MPAEQGWKASHFNDEETGQSCSFSVLLLPDLEELVLRQFAKLFVSCPTGWTIPSAFVASGDLRVCLEANWCGKAKRNQWAVLGPEVPRALQADRLRDAYFQNSIGTQTLHQVCLRW